MNILLIGSGGRECAIAVFQMVTYTVIRILKTLKLAV